MGMYYIIQKVRKSYKKAGFKTWIDRSKFSETGMIMLLCCDYDDGVEDTIFCFYKTLDGCVYESHKGLQPGCFWTDEREVSCYV